MQYSEKPENLVTASASCKHEMLREATDHGLLNRIRRASMLADMQTMHVW